MEKADAAHKKQSLKKAWSSFMESLDKKMKQKAEKGRCCCSPSDNKEQSC